MRPDFKSSVAVVSHNALYDYESRVAQAYIYCNFIAKALLKPYLVV